jgi:type VII secretion-associated serine protease mycosin
MLTLSRTAALAALFVASALAVLPGAAAGAAVSQPGSVAVAGSASVAADTIRDNQQWVLDMMDVQPAWQLSQGAGVTVAVIDSGVDPYVSDLVGSVTTGPDYTDLDTPPSNPNWGLHGTWMASLISGHGHGADGGSGIIGIAPASRILSIRVIPDRSDPHYGQYQREREARIQQSLADGIDYAVTHGAKVISMSIGYGAPSKPVRQALQRAYSRGVVVVASAGNSGAQADIAGDNQAPVSFPANYPGVISVAAVNSAGSVANFSSDNLSVQLAAPGVSVPAQGRDGQYWLVSGTSPACALVAGVAALIKSRYPDLAPNLVADALTSTAADRPRGGYDSQVGFGIVDAAAALAQAGQLSGERPARAGITAATRFGGGPSAVPPEPVTPRGSGPLVLFALLALASLTLVGVAAARLLVLGRSAR